MAEIRETERKYEFEPGVALPSLHDLPSVSRVSDLAEQTLEAEYYDTADLRMVRSGVALQPVALVTTERHGRVLLDHSGDSLAELVEDEVSARTLGESTTLTHWREAEIEL